MHACSCSMCSMYACSYSAFGLNIVLPKYQVYFAKASFSFNVMMAWRHAAVPSSCTGMEKKSMEACFADCALATVYTGMKTMETRRAA